MAIVLGLVLVLWPTEVLELHGKDYRCRILCYRDYLFSGISCGIRMNVRQGTDLFNGIGSIILGILLWSMADFFTNMLMYLLGFILIVAGIGQLVMLTSARKFGHIAPLSYVYPVIILLAGLIVFANPFSAKEGIITFFGAVTIFYGITDLINHYKVNQLRKETHGTEQQQKMGGGEIEDAEYEEIE